MSPCGWRSLSWTVKPPCGPVRGASVLGQVAVKASLHVRATEDAQKRRVFSENEQLILEEGTSESCLKPRCCTSGWWPGPALKECLTDPAFKAFLVLQGAIS